MTIPVHVALLRQQPQPVDPAAAGRERQRRARRATALAESHAYGKRLLEAIAGQESAAPELAAELRAAVADPEALLSELLIEATIAWPVEAQAAARRARESSHAA